MRVVNCLGVVALVGIAALLSVGSAVAQGSGADPGRWASAPRVEGTPSGSVVMPGAISEFRAELRVFFARFYMSGWPVLRVPAFAAPADVPSRKRLSRMQ